MADDFATAYAQARARRRTSTIVWTIIGALLGGGLGALITLGAASTLVTVLATGGALLLGALIAWFVCRRRARQEAHLMLSAAWADAHGWQYFPTVTFPVRGIDFLHQGTRSYTVDGAMGTLADHPATFANFTVETERTDSEGNTSTSYDYYFLILLQRDWSGPPLRLVRRSFTWGRHVRDAVRSKVTAWQTVEIEDDRMAGRYQVQLPDGWGKDVAFFLLPPDLQEALATNQRLDEVRFIESTPHYLFLAWNKHFSAQDLPRLERRLNDAAWLQQRWQAGVPAHLHPPAA